MTEKFVGAGEEYDELLVHFLFKSVIYVMCQRKKVLEREFEENKRFVIIFVRKWEEGGHGC
jgi:hypothetical protein